MYFAGYSGRWETQHLTEWRVLVRARKLEASNEFSQSEREKGRFLADNGEAIPASLRALHILGIPAIPLKGLFLAQNLYKDIGLRATSDIDILVPAKFTEAAFNLTKAYSDVGRNADAIATAHKALRLAESSKNVDLTRQLEKWLRAHDPSVGK